MSSPVSTSGGLGVGEQCLEGAVPVGGVGGFVLPAAPDDAEPGSGQDAGGVGMVLAAGDGVVVDLRGPGVSAAGVAGEVADGVAEFLVDRPSVGDSLVFAGLFGRGGDTGQTGQGSGVGEPPADVADLGEQPGGAHGAAAGQGLEDVGVGVQGELLGDLGFQSCDLFDELAQDAEHGAGEVGTGSAIGSDRSAGCGLQVGEQIGGVLATAVADAAQPRGQALDAEPVGAFLRVEAGQEPQADLGVEVLEESHGAGESGLQVRTELVAQRDAVLDQFTTGADGGAQRLGCLAVVGQRSQPSPVGAQGVGQDVGVEPVVLVAGRTVAAAQVLEPVRADHHDSHVGVEQGVDDRSVAAFDGDLADTVLVEKVHQGTESGGGVFDGLTRDLEAAVVDDADRMILAGPVHATGDTVDGLVGQFATRGGAGRLHVSLLAARPSGEAPAFRCRDASVCQLTDRRSQPSALALSPVDDRGVPGNRRAPQNSSWTSRGRASRAVTRRHLGCISGPSRTTDVRKVVQ